MRFPSAECRWFWVGDPSPDLLGWFRQSYTASSLAARTDRYLRPTGPGLGIKWREGLVEIKQRQSTSPGVRLDTGQEGTLETYVKWSFPIDPGTSILPELRANPGAWFEVHKERRLRTFILEGEEVTETAPGSHPRKGCQAELTRLRAGGRAWYTFGLEAFGHSADRVGLLRSVAAFLLDPDCPLWLRQQESMGYAEWLETHYR